MLSDFTGADRVYIACGYTDLRRGIDGLAVLIQQQFHLDPFTNTLFLFCGRRRDRIKALYWEGNGFVLLYKRLESGSFQWPRKESEAKALTPQQYRWLMEALRLARHKQFGASSEKSEEPLMEQLSFLFNEAEVFAETKAEEDHVTVVAAHKRHKKHEYALDNIPEDMPTKQVEHRLEGEDLVCPQCGDTMTEIGKEVVRTLEIIPAQTIVREDIYYSYACKHCSENADEGCETPVVKAPREKNIIPGSSASQGLTYCNLLFGIEQEIADKTAEERYNERLEQAKPVLDAMLSWANSRTAAPKSALGKAFHYLKEQWPYLTNYLKDGRLEISNNRAERSMKPFVIDRKNFLFANTPKGATGSAIMFSLIQTAIENSLDPYKYLTWLMKIAKDADLTNNQIVQNLLPWNAAAEYRVK